MRTIIAGSREAPIEETMAAIESCPWRAQISRVVSGKAKGPDSHGEQWAYTNDIPVDDYPADWDRYGKAAGAIRNEEMACNADALIAVWDGTSRGTADMVRRAEAKGLKVHVHRYVPKALAQLRKELKKGL